MILIVRLLFLLMSAGSDLVVAIVEIRLRGLVVEDCDLQLLLLDQ